MTKEQIKECAKLIEQHDKVSTHITTILRNPHVVSARVRAGMMDTYIPAQFIISALHLHQSEIAGRLQQEFNVTL